MGAEVTTDGDGCDDKWGAEATTGGINVTTGGG